MHWQYTPYVLPLFVAMAISIALAFYAWRRRSARGALAFALMMLAVAEWQLGNALELGSTDLQGKIFWSKVEYLGIVTVPLAWLAFTLQHTGQERWLTLRNMALLAIVPLITLSLVWTGEGHHLIWSHIGLDDSGSFSVLHVTYGPWFWIHSSYFYLLLLLGTTWLVLMYLRPPGLYRQQAGALLLAVLAPWVGNALYLSGLSRLDLAPFAFTLSGIALAWALFRFRLLDIVPVALRAVVDGIGDSVIVLDAQNRIVDLNPAAQRVIGLPASDTIGRPLAEVLADHADLIERCCDVTKARAEIALGEGEARRYYDLHISPLTDRRGNVIGRSAVLHDITAHRQTEESLRAQKQLFESLVAVARATAEQPSLEATLRNALDVASSLTGAERGSLFLLDESGAVSHSILGLGQEKPEQWDAIVATVMNKGLGGWVFRHRQAALVYDVLRDERWLPLPYDQGIQSSLVVPIISGPRVLGLLNLLHSQLGHFSPEHLHLMQAAADQMALAVRNAQIFDTQRRTADRQSTLYEILTIVGAHLDPQAIASAAVEAVARLVGWPAVAVLLPDDTATHLVVQAAAGDFSIAERWRMSFDQGVIGRAFRTAQTQHVPDVSADPDYVSGHPAICCELAVPLLRGEQVLGVLNVESNQPAFFGADDVLLAESLAEAIALALDNARLYEEASRRAADLDALYAVARMVSRSLVQEDVLSQALSSALLSLGFEAGVISLADSADGRLRLVVEHGLPSLLSRRLRYRGLEGTLCDYVHTRRETLVLEDLSQETPIDVSAMVALGFRAYAGIPLLHQQQSLGSISLFSRQSRPSSTYELALLTAIGHQVATAVANARLYQNVADERSRLQSLIESSRDGIILIGTDLRVLLMNAPALKLLRLPGEPESWAGRPITDALTLLRRHAPAVVRATLTEMRRNQRGDEPAGEGEYDVPPRAIRWLNLPVLADTIALGRLLVLRDVTEERLLEKMRDDLTHTMVHDLRNPLTAIVNSLQLLGQIAGDLSTDQRFMLEIARGSTQKMLKLVNDILDVSRLESGRMLLERTAVSLADLIAETLRAQSLLAADKSLRLESDAPPALPPAWADARLIERVLQNLVDNAIKFTPPGGLVKVTARPGDQEPAEPPHLRVSVADSGPGIPPELQSKMFQKFVVGQREKGGSGLGLAFCKLVVEAHGGHIWFESEPEQGTTFTFTLPLVRENG